VGKIKRNATVSTLVAMSIAIHSVEMFIPSPFPWLRFGFANIIVLTAIALYGLRVGLMVTILRVFLGTILMGTFLTPAFFLGMGGGIGSTLVMGFAYRKFKAFFSLVGISVMGAYTHNIIQLTIVYLVFIRHSEVFYILPVPFWHFDGDFEWGRRHLSLHIYGSYFLPSIGIHFVVGIQTEKERIVIFAKANLTGMGSSSNIGLH
jgi:heptaprenyl diphosphate synthase